LQDQRGGDSVLLQRMYGVRSTSKQVLVLETGNSTVTPVCLAISLSPIGRGTQSFHLLPPPYVYRLYMSFNGRWHPPISRALPTAELSPMYHLIRQS